jgi:hypothetical protein
VLKKDKMENSESIAVVANKRVAHCGCDEILNKYSIEQLENFIKNNKETQNYPAITQEYEDIIWTDDQFAFLHKVKIHLNDLTKGKESCFRYILTGLAGSGKSKLIQEVKKLYEHHGKGVKICAPFGIAAANVGGCTLHNLLGINYYKTSNFEKLAKRFKASKKIINKFKNVKLIILEEFLTAGASLFNNFNLVLSEATETYRDFGGLDVLLCADYSQIPPPAQVSLLADPSLHHGFVGQGIDLYRQFTKVCILKTSYRQANDDRFNQLLLNIRRKAVTKSDIELLRTRRVCKLDKKELDTFTEATFIFPRNAHSRAHNEKYLRALGTTIYFPHQTTANPTLTSFI